MNKKGAKISTIELLDLFLGIPEAFLYGFDRKEFYRILQNKGHEKELTVANICNLFHNLKKSKYIEVSGKSDTESIRFTNKARLLIIDRIADKRPKDNKYRFISFDIPERLRRNRDQFRRVIKRLGFIQVQKSLWVTDRNIGNLIELSAKEYKVNDYVVYLVTEETNIDSYIKSILKKEICPSKIYDRIF